MRAGAALRDAPHGELNSRKTRSGPLCASQTRFERRLHGAVRQTVPPDREHAPPRVKDRAGAGQRGGRQGSDARGRAKQQEPAMGRAMAVGSGPSGVLQGLSR